MKFLQYGTGCAGECSEVTESSIPYLLNVFTPYFLFQAMIKKIKQYSAKFGCDKCSQETVHIGRSTYQQITNLPLRTDDTFRRKSNAKHHKRGNTPFTKIQDLDMIAQFPIDYMHQVCLGVMRKLIRVWISGKVDKKARPNKLIKLVLRKKRIINSRLAKLKALFPDCFQRRPRSLNEIDFWKSSELRSFLLYSGPMVLKGMLEKPMYDHFMYLSAAINILVCPYLCSQPALLQKAREFLEYFVSQAKVIYGEKFLVYNVHSLLHLVDDVERFGCLDNFSCFPFENYNQSLKKMVRSGNYPLQQIIKRLSETESSLGQPKKLSLSLSSKHPSNKYVTYDRHCCEVLEQIKDPIDGADYVRVKDYGIGQKLFGSPLDSREIGFYKVQTNASVRQVWPLENIRNKAIMISDKSGTAAFLSIKHEMAE